MRLLALACLMTLLIGGSMASAEVRTESFERVVTKKVSAKYAVLLPDGYDSKPGEKWPTIVFLHGSGERGDDPTELLKSPVMERVQQTGAGRFIVVVPRCPEGQQWDPDTLNALLDEVQAKYRIDPDRVYLTGYSMGGTGVWTIAMEHPERFAAIAPVCGRVINVLAYRLKDMPIWCFHGDKDDMVDFSFSVQMVAKLKDAGAKDVQFTVYPGVKHNAWDPTYSNPELYEWFLSNKRGARGK